MNTDYQEVKTLIYMHKNFIALFIGNFYGQFCHFLCQISILVISKFQPSNNSSSSGRRGMGSLLSTKLIIEITQVRENILKLN